MKTQDRLASPPRRLGPLKQLALLNAGASSFMGWMFLGMGLCFTFIFLGQSTLPYMFRFDGPWEWKIGVVEQSYWTNASENDSRIYGIDFNYQVEGQTYKATSYSFYSGYTPGDTVEIEYKPQRPERARMADCREALFDPWVAFILLFPLFGAGFLIAAWRRNIRLIRLLRRGEMVRGVLKNKKSTNTTINNSRVYRYFFHFEYQRSTYTAQGKTHKGHLMEDEDLERILFAPQNPNYNIVYDAYPQAPEIDKQGFFRPLPLRSYLILLFAGFWIGLNSFIYYALFVS